MKVPGEQFHNPQNMPVSLFFRLWKSHMYDSQFLPLVATRTQSIFVSYKKKRKIRVWICQIMTMNTKAHNTYPGNYGYRKTRCPVPHVPYHLLSSMTDTQNAVRQRRPAAQISSVALLICQPSEICQRPTAQSGRLLWKEQRSVTAAPPPQCTAPKRHIREPFWICDGVLALTTAFNNMGEKIINKEYNPAPAVCKQLRQQWFQENGNRSTKA